MKNLLFLVLIASTQVYSQANRVLRIVYIDNYGSNSEGDKGLPEVAQSYIDANIVSFTQDKYLFYLQDGTNPKISLNNEDDLNNLLGGIPKDRTLSSTVFYDKKRIWEEINKFSDLKFTSIEVHFFLSREFLKDNLFNYNQGFLTTYFFRELKYAFQPDKIDFYYYHNEETPKEISYIENSINEIFAKEGSMKNPDVEKVFRSGIFEGKSSPIITVLK